MNEIPKLQISETGEPSGGDLSPQGLASSRRCSASKGVIMCDKALILWDKRNHQFKPVLVDRVNGEYADIEIEGVKRSSHNQWLYEDTPENQAHVAGINNKMLIIQLANEEIQRHLKEMTSYKPKEGGE